jgi:flagellar hook-length control protein FliK
VAPVAANLEVAPQRDGADAATPSSLGALGVTIAAKSVDGVRHFDIRLDPPELGRVQVHLTVDDSGKAEASLVIDKPQTLELLQRDAPNLNRALTDAGLDLSNNGLNFSLRGGDRQNDGGSVDKGRGRTLSVKAVVGAISTSSSIASFAPNSVRLDIRV